MKNPSNVASRRQKMKAIICTKYGPPEVLKIKDVNLPILKDNQVLIKIHATTVTAGDTELRRSKFPAWMWLMARLGFGIIAPRKKIIGQEFSGEIEKVGENVKNFKVGDQVYGTTGFRLGTYAEYTSMPENGIFTFKPKNLTYEEAAAVPVGGLEALHFIRRANIKAEHKLLINGAGGSIGTIAVQLAKLRDCEVIAVDHTSKAEMLRSIGVDRFIDYTREDFTKMGKNFDAILDIVGNTPFSRCVELLNENGSYLLANPSLFAMIKGRQISKKTSKKVITGASEQYVQDLTHLKRLFEDGRINVVIDRSFTLDEIKEAHVYVETGKKLGNVVIKVI